MRGRTTFPPPLMEQPAKHPPLAPKAHPRLAGPVRVVITSYLRRLRDADGTSSKYIVDGLVDAGILPGDGPDVVTEVSHRQVKADQDRTTIEIFHAGPP